MTQHTKPKKVTSTRWTHRAAEERNERVKKRGEESKRFVHIFHCEMTRGLSINPKQRSVVLCTPQTSADNTRRHTERERTKERKKRATNNGQAVHTNPTNFAWNYSWFKRNDNCSPGTLSIGIFVPSHCGPLARNFGLEFSLHCNLLTRTLTLAGIVVVVVVDTTK